jgi:ribosome maturation factor RimP
LPDNIVKPKKQNTVQIAEEIIRPVLEEHGLELWDTRFEKEGATWYLRYFIDKPEGVNINDLELVSRAVDKLLDAADPIDQSYTLEVCSPGVERQLTKDAHFERYAGSLVNVRLIRPVEGMRDFLGTLTGKDDEGVHITLDIADAETGDPIEMVVKLKEAAYVRLYVDFASSGGQKE